MKARLLIKLLQEFDPELDVYFYFNCNRDVPINVTLADCPVNVDLVNLVYSGHSKYEMVVGQGDLNAYQPDEVFEAIGIG